MRFATPDRMCEVKRCMMLKRAVVFAWTASCVEWGFAAYDTGMEKEAYCAHIRDPLTGALNFHIS